MDYDSTALTPELHRHPLGFDFLPYCGGFVKKQFGDGGGDFYLDSGFVNKFNTFLGVC